MAGYITQGPPLHQFGTPGASLRSVGTERRTERRTEQPTPRTTFGLDFLSTCAQDDPDRVYASPNNGVQAPGSMFGVLPDPDRWRTGTPCLMSDFDWPPQEPLDEGLPWFEPDSMASYCDQNNQTAAFTAAPTSRAPAPFLSASTAPERPPCEHPSLFQCAPSGYVTAPALSARASDAWTPPDSGFGFQVAGSGAIEPAASKKKGDRFHPKNTLDMLFHWVPPCTLNPEPYTPNPEPRTLNPKP